MNQQSKLEVIDKDGWQKTYPLNKNIIYIGSHARNDIILEGMHGVGVAPLHAQLIAPANHNTGYQLVNLGDTDIMLGESGDQSLPPRSVAYVIDGTVFKLGDFTLIFHAAGGGYYGGSTSSSSRYIGLSLSVPHTRLAPNQSLDGVVTVRNLGDRTGVQMELELEGLDPDCYDLEPGPLLSSGAEKEVFFRLHHRGPKPLAGDWSITIRATAPRAYPAEQAAVSQMIQVLPFYHHQLKLVSPGESDTLPQAEEELLTPKAQAGPLPQAKERPISPPAPSPPQATPAPQVETGEQAEDWWTAPAAKPPVETAPPRAAETIAAPPVDTAPPPQVAVEQPVSAVKPDTPPQAEMMVPPQAEVVSPPQVAAEQVPGVEAGIAPRPEAPPTPQVEAVSPPQVETEPVPEIEPSRPAQVGVGQPPPPQVEVDTSAPSEKAPPPVAETAPQPQKRWWTRLAQFLPFYSRQAPAQPSTSTETGEQLGIEEEAATQVEAGPPPQAEEMQPPEEVQADIPTPGEAEMEAAGLPPVEAGEPPSALPEQMPLSQPEEEAEQRPSPVEADIVPSVMEADQVPETEISPPPQPMPATQAAEVEPWWPIEADTPTLVDEKETLKLKASPPPQPEPAVEAETPAEVEDWWPTEADTPAVVEEKEALKLKASPSSEEPEPAVEAETPAEAEDWWTEADTSTPVEEKGALKLKASLPSQPEPVVKAETPAEAEDWWAAEVDTSTPVEEKEALKLRASPPPPEPAVEAETPSKAGTSGTGEKKQIKAQE